MIEPRLEALPQGRAAFDVDREFFARQTFFYQVEEQQIDFTSRAYGIVVECRLGSGRVCA